VKRKHALFISVLLGVAVLAGGLAVVRTAGLGASSTQAATVPDSVVAGKQAALDAYEVSLRAALARRPPKLPALVKARNPATGTAGATKVVYVRAQASPAQPADDGHETARESGGDEGGGFDD
jgi:hypothetical protein